MLKIEKNGNKRESKLFLPLKAIYLISYVQDLAIGNISLLDQLKNGIFTERNELAFIVVRKAS